MRLQQIKLSGFKSFAEPTTFQLPGQRVGVVGPNGCGKSNIIDAVRWVLGESRAGELRGESMQDLIFNGSAQRKPAQRASVELVFDNADARAGGPWAGFAEIAIRRVLTRDGSSSYFINNQAVRRRDVQDVFLGTGLGPRAYAIIGQGTISRIIESRPEELRLFLEEAAGVSKYKERRRETENRLKDTRENLTRVEDILRELDANLERLQRQAEVAERYHALQDQALRRQHQQWFLKHRDAAAEHTRVAADLANAEARLQEQAAELRQAEAALESVRQAHYGAGDRLHAAQGALAESSLEVSRLEERIRYVVQSRQRLQQRVAELRASDLQWAQREKEARDEIARLQQQIVEAEAQASALAAQAEEQAAALPQREQAWRSAQSRAQSQREAAAAVQQQIQLLAAEGRSREDRLRAARSRRERQQAERQGLVGDEGQALEELRQRRDTTAAQAEQAQARLAEIDAELNALRSKAREDQDSANRESAQQAGITARLQALRALQEKLRSGGKLEPWLARHGLQALQGLWTRLHVEPGWEPALESALRERLSALEVGRLETVQAFAEDSPPARLAFFSPGASPGPDENRALPRLVDKLRLGDAGLKALLADWLQGVFTAASLQEALSHRGRLGRGEVVMTAEGHAVSSFAVSFYAPDSEQAGMLARAQDIENLERELRAQQLITEDARSVLVRTEAALTDAQRRLSEGRAQAQSAQKLAHELQLQWTASAQRVQAASNRRGQLDVELAELDSELQTLEAQREAEQARLELLDAELATQQQRHADLEEISLAQERDLAAAREGRRDLERQAQEADFGVRSLRARQAELERTVQSALEQMQRNADTGSQLELEIGGLDDEAERAGLQAALAIKLQREGELGAVRSEYDDLSARLRQGEEQRMALEQALGPQRESITRLQLEQQAAQLGGAQFMEQLQAAGADLQALERSVAEEGVKLWGLQSEIDRLQREIGALGAVNLAALEELTHSRERKGFLDAQNADLNQAIDTLEDAIRKIDLETRDLLRKTFDEVNSHFGRLFPTLFGGGSARLEMTGQEILDAGVQVMAQPPGKRNATIHLLSGGEKALTAIALVFAIFQLNPAPFCLLDEVDAPLDDANTERYGRLVTQMSRETQFLFISHNKITMEIAEQLIGVTTQEKGVSRIVAVDVESAVTLAKAA